MAPMQYVLRVRRAISGARDEQGNPIAVPLMHEEVVPLDSLCGVRTVVDETIDDDGASTVGSVTLQVQVGGSGPIPANTRLQSLPSRYVAVGMLTRFDDASIIARLYA